MNKKNSLKKAVEICDDLNKIDEIKVSDVVNIASSMIAICMVHYGFTDGEILDGAIKAVNEDIKDTIDIIKSIKDDAEK